MEFETIGFSSELGNEVLKRLNNKRKINDYCLNMAVSKCQVSLAKFDLMEHTVQNMIAMMQEKVESENSMEEGTFIYMTKSEKTTEDEILITLTAEVYILDVS